MLHEKEKHVVNITGYESCSFSTFSYEYVNHGHFLSDVPTRCQNHPVRDFLRLRYKLFKKYCILAAKLERRFVGC